MGLSERLNAEGPVALRGRWGDTRYGYAHAEYGVVAFYCVPTPEGSTFELADGDMEPYAGEGATLREAWAALATEFWSSWGGAVDVFMRGMP